MKCLTARKYNSPPLSNELRSSQEDKRTRQGGNTKLRKKRGVRENYDLIIRDTKNWSSDWIRCGTWNWVRMTLADVILVGAVPTKAGTTTAFVYRFMSVVP